MRACPVALPCGGLAPLPCPVGGLPRCLALWGACPVGGPGGGAGAPRTACSARPAAAPPGGGTKRNKTERNGTFQRGHLLSVTALLTVSCDHSVSLCALRFALQCVRLAYAGKPPRKSPWNGTWLVPPCGASLRPPVAGNPRHSSVRYSGEAVRGPSDAAGPSSAQHNHLQAPIA